MQTQVVRSTSITRTARVAQLEGYFDLAPEPTSTVTWDVDLPIEARPWSLGLIVGPSGSGKSTVARELFGDRVVAGFDWPADRSVVDGFPKAMSIKDITALLSSVGFSSPPAWLRPFAVLSTGEQFRVTLARALAESGPALTVMDEFTSVVDRRVAQIGSAALATTVRRQQQQFIAVTCHTDVEDWLQPDWVYQPHLAEFHWRELQRRPEIPLRLTRCGPENWVRFRAHHYLNRDLAPSAKCFLTWWGDVPVGFTAVLPLMGFKNRWREHRTVCLPEFQGVGIGMAQSRLVAAVVTAATGGEYSSTTSHPAFVAARARSKDWRSRNIGGGGKQKPKAQFPSSSAGWAKASGTRSHLLGRSTAQFMPPHTQMGRGSAYSATAKARRPSAKFTGAHTQSVLEGGSKAYRRQTAAKAQFASVHKAVGIACGAATRGHRSFRLMSSFVYVGQPLADVVRARALWLETFAGGRKRSTQTVIAAEAVG